MDDNRLDNNPFASLFPSITEAAQFSQLNKDDEVYEEETPEQNTHLVPNLLERIFLFSNKPREVSDLQCVVVIESSKEEYEPTLEFYQEALFDRLLLLEVADHVKIIDPKKSPQNYQDVTEANPITYLFSCYDRMMVEKSNAAPEILPTIHQSHHLIIRTLATAILTPELFELKQLTSQQMMSDILALLQQAVMFQTPYTISCMKDTVFELAKDDSNLGEVFQPLMKEIVQSIEQGGVTDLETLNLINVLSALSTIDGFGDVVLNFKYVPKNITAIFPSSLSTILGLIMSKTCLITEPTSTSHDFFDEVSTLQQQGVEREEERLQSHMDSFHNSVHQLLQSLLQNQHSRSKLLSWIDLLMTQHAYCAKLWTHEHANPATSVFHTDAIFLNLSSILLKLSLPFCADKAEQGKSSEKFLKIDPSYCVATGCPQRSSRGVHLQGLNKETTILTPPDDSPPPILSTSYNFISECFFTTHRSFYLGLHGLLVKLYKLNRQLGRMQSLYRDAMASGVAADSRVKQVFERALAVFLSTKATISNQSFIENAARFYATTARFLIQMAFTDDRSKRCEYKLPLGDEPPQPLYYIPELTTLGIQIEFIVENLLDFLVFLKRFSPESLEELQSFIYEFLLLIALYMGNKTRMKNPHLRATFAEALEGLLPLDTEQSSVTVENRRSSFVDFQHVAYLTTSVVHLFVDIEFTDDPHQFEQKFNYRRPLYPILRFLWDEEQGRGKQAIREKALEALQSIEATKPPLLLSFINLFLNDSIFLIDEAIDHMRQIKVQEQERDEGEWEQLAPQEKNEKEMNLQQLVSIARFHNIMSNETVEALSYMSTLAEVQDLLCHSVLVQRIANMLNHFLLHLVGAKQKMLKVKDFSHCAFKPQELVAGICSIYSHLAHREEFCIAVVQDGRSYSPDLFPRAIRVLRRINNFELGDKIRALSDRVKEFGSKELTEEEIFQDAPDEFFDPIMGTLMRDPVILPSSKKTMDRSTIARHLLSDHSDPYNRSPLTMEDIQPDEELRLRIEAWGKGKQS